MTQPFDVVGVGLNAVDTLVLVPNFPAYAGKVAFEREALSFGGQVAGAMAACAGLGMRAKYIGAVGDDASGRMQIASLRDAGIDVEDLEIRENCATQRAYIIVDQSTGERTIFWNRPDCLNLDPAALKPETIAAARMLHVDGHDTAAVEQAARIARQHSIPVSVDVDTIYPGFDRVLGSVDYLIASTEFPGRWTGESDPFRALKQIQAEYRMKVAGMTLGQFGALALHEGRFVYSPGFVVPCADTTGAGDVFHGAFCYAVLAGMPLRDILEFSNAMAALNCTRLGARAGIASLGEIRALIQRAASDPGLRRSHQDYAPAAQRA